MISSSAGSLLSRVLPPLYGRSAEEFGERSGGGRSGAQSRIRVIRRSVGALAPRSNGSCVLGSELGQEGTSERSQLEFLRDDRFNAPEIRSAKTSLNCRESYGDVAIDYVQLKHENFCVKYRAYPEHKVQSKALTTLFINEATKKIDIQCHDCGYKHALAVLMWIHRRSEDPALPTEVACYWKKSCLSSVGTRICRNQEFEHPKNIEAEIIHSR
ncbi:PREDICTED: uncharacterized protein LOC105617840 [Atta cephalotes]|uniref:Uncharacterized protein n=1 Tax=Atta cephalotes TaxID=12957 RepID=A0A158NB73_ATTCE|nr:PREDICTED: uncharacterized protein LOC105617840 [Atta cephalotes]